MGEKIKWECVFKLVIVVNGGVVRSCRESFLELLFKKLNLGVFIYWFLFLIGLVVLKRIINFFIF